MAIEKQLGDNWRRSGVINRIGRVEGQTVMLAVLPNDTQTGETLRIKDTELYFTVQALPYDISD